MNNPFRKFFGGQSMEDTITSEAPAIKDEKRITGKVIKVSKEGYGFISSKEVPFTRIFFHWTSLQANTMRFTDLRAGMKVSCVAYEVEDKGWRAIKIKVEEETEPKSSDAVNNG